MTSGSFDSIKTRFKNVQDENNMVNFFMEFSNNWLF